METVNYGRNKFYYTGPRGQRYATFYGRKLQIFVIGQSDCPRIGVHSRATWLGSGLTRKHWTGLERLAKDKHSSLLRKFWKKFFVRLVPIFDSNMLS